MWTVCVCAGVLGGKHRLWWSTGNWGMYACRLGLTRSPLAESRSGQRELDAACMWLCPVIGSPSCRWVVSASVTLSHHPTSGAVCNRSLQGVWLQDVRLMEHGIGTAWIHLVVGVMQVFSCRVACVEHEDSTCVFLVSQPCKCGWTDAGVLNRQHFAEFPCCAFELQAWMWNTVFKCRICDA